VDASVVALHDSEAVIDVDRREAEPIVEVRHRGGDMPDRESWDRAAEGDHAEDCPTSRAPGKGRWALRPSPRTCVRPREHVRHAVPFDEGQRDGCQAFT